MLAGLGIIKNRLQVGKGAKNGFTLIELSIVLVIIGLLVGGVLVGQDLIKAAEVRATITQIEKFNTAVNTFLGKYGELPGDMSAASAARFNFPPYNPGCNNNRCGTQGRGDGNGILDAFTTSVISNPSGSLSGEVAMFWGDLSYANLIGFDFGFDQSDTYINGAAFISNVDSVLPAAKLGGGNYITVMGYGGQNYFLLFAVTGISADGVDGYSLGSNPGVSVQQAYAIDAKIDDGLPQSGRVTAQYLTSAFNYNWVGVAPGVVATGSPATCYDNGGAITNPMAYSIAQNNGAGVNCALSFQFQ